MKTRRTILLMILILSMFSCSDNKKKEILWKVFCDFQMRDIPTSNAHFDKLNDYDIVYQDRTSINDRYYYPDTYVIGLYDNDSKSYNRIHTLEGFSPTDNYTLIKAASDFYSSDTTYLDNIQYTDTLFLDNKNIPLLKDTICQVSKDQYQASFKMKNKMYIVLVYRKTNPAKRDKTIGEYMMWKREIIRFENNKIKTELIEQMNEHTF